MMKASINKLLEEYKKKISDCDVLSKNIDFKNSNIEFKIILAKRQAYVQAMVDIDSLLDAIEV